MTYDLCVCIQQVRDLQDRLLKNQRIIDQLHEEIKKLKDGQGGGGCDTNVIIQRVCLSLYTILFYELTAGGVGD